MKKIKINQIKDFKEIINNDSNLLIAGYFDDDLKNVRSEVSRILTSPHNELKSLSEMIWEDPNKLSEILESDQKVVAYCQTIAIDVLTYEIKSLFPCKIVGRVQSRIDSRIAMDINDAFELERGEVIIVGGDSHPPHATFGEVKI